MFPRQQSVNALDPGDTGEAENETVDELARQGYFLQFTC